MAKRRLPFWAYVRTFVVLGVVSSVWMGVFLTLSSSAAPPLDPEPSEGTKSVRQRFVKFAAVQRKQLDLDQYYNDRHLPGMLDAMVEFTESAPLPPKAIGLDGFVPKHIDITQGDNGVNSVFAVFTRRPPFEWPRSLDVSLGKDYSVRADLVDGLTSKEFASYRVNSSARLEMKSPNGQFTWEISKDKDLMTSPKCLFRQDLYKDGEWIKSLLAIAK